MSKAFKRWEKFFDSLPQNHPGTEPVFTERDHRSLKGLCSRRPKTVTQGVWENFIKCVNEYADLYDIGITQEHHDKGQAWLKKIFPVIRRQRNKDSMCMTLEALNQFEEVAKNGVRQFFFGGFMDASTPFSRRHFSDTKVMVPIWKVVMQDGTRFSYAYGSWQGYGRVEYNPPFDAEEL